MSLYETALEAGGLDALAAILHDTSVEKGFWDEEVNVHFILSKLALIHSEVSEVLEAVRKEMGEDVVLIEIVDIIIRCLDLYGGLYDNGILHGSLDEAMKIKMDYNQSRERKHGNLA